MNFVSLCILVFQYLFRAWLFNIMPSDSSCSVSSIFGGMESFNESTRDRSTSSLDLGQSSQLRVLLSDGFKGDRTIGALSSSLTQFGEIQHIDMSRLQFDSTITVSYFDIRAAALAKASLVSGAVAGLHWAHARSRANSSVSNSFIQPIEHIPHSCSAAARSVDVLGFCSDDIMSHCNDFLLSVFGRFGEVDTIMYNGNDSFRVVFFDSRSPLAVHSALFPTGQAEWTDQVIVSSEQLVMLLLLGNQAPVVAPIAPPPMPSTWSGRMKSSGPTLTSTPPEYLVNLRNIEKGLDSRTTVMIRNIPRSYTQVFLIELINSKFAAEAGAFDFLYLPLDLVTSANLGYAFINFRKPESIITFFNTFNNKNWRHIISALSKRSPGDPEEGSKIAKVTFARIQGLKPLMEHFSKSSIMNQPDSIRPYFARQ